MANAMLNMHVIQLRMMSVKQAADYASLPFRRFLRIYSVRPVALPDSKPCCDVCGVDGWLDQIKAGDADTVAEKGRL
ncbi:MULTISPECIES: hypothetical protein [Rhizobium/Agrobacterium group]|uniref:Uncharacterized protein n=2 Tax=Agrobacterium vitis TaxID=373 RepID=A0ABD6HG28_AGRVI|nr:MULTISPECIES: hypothetical protein [Rhizobium/Agrobacterium group]MUO29566.1 hypothetical protein [Agrobacterium vitis]MUO44119.1 hypothetical protein [Agrobacterium vitis]MUP13133.1 hypothetical protein [Agrobacterium vitis]